MEDPFHTRKTHDGSMGRTVDLPIHEWLICMVNLGKFTVRPMDPMGDGSR